MEEVLAVVDAVRGALGAALLLAAAIAFVVLGNTTGRVIGVALLAVFAIPVARAVRRRR